MGTFLLNNRYATVLFDSGSVKSFVNTSFSHLIDINPVRLNTSYESLKLRDTNIAAYTQRFHELVLLCPEEVPTKKRRLKLTLKVCQKTIRERRPRPDQSTLMRLSVWPIHSWNKRFRPRQKGFLKETKENGKIHRVARGTTTTTKEIIKATTATNNTTTRGKEIREH
uniref:Reverse transcriptase domain-containing protein n=1 Tax=Tanacetum cinerariifolium TaxID=118510 RepID=A0A699RH44_TANCI|nr:reverse transcriptase domain-containing protein [Tanacetum cinerariifolium]